MCVKEKGSKTVSVVLLYTADTVILRDTVLCYYHCYFICRASGEYRRLQTTATVRKWFTTRQLRFASLFDLTLTFVQRDTGKKIESIEIQQCSGGMG